MPLRVCVDTLDVQLMMAWPGAVARPKSQDFSAIFRYSELSEDKCGSAFARAAESLTPVSDDPRLRKIFPKGFSTRLY